MWIANPDILEFDDVAISSHNLTINQYVGLVSLDSIQIPLDACGQANLILNTQRLDTKFLNPERKRCRIAGYMWTRPKSYQQEISVKNREFTSQNHFLCIVTTNKKLGNNNTGKYFKVHLTSKYFFRLNKSLHLSERHCAFLN